jgi:hypothetical protein
MSFRRFESFFYIGNDGFHGDGTGRVVEIEEAINLLLRRRHTALLIKINPEMKDSLRDAVLNEPFRRSTWADVVNRDPTMLAMNVEGYRFPAIDEILIVSEDQLCPSGRFAIESTSPL